MQESKFIVWSRAAYIGGLVLALLFIIPVPWFPLQLGKVALCAALLAISAIFFVLGGGMRELARARGFGAEILIFFLPLSYALSFYFSIDRSVGLVGYGVEADTLLFTLIGALVFFLGFALFRTQAAGRLLVTVLLWALALVAVFQCIAVVFGTAAIPLPSFADRTVNAVGKWNDLGILLSLGVLFLLVRLEFSALRKIVRTVLVVLLLLIATLLASIYFSLLWWLLLAGALLVGLAAFLSRRGAGAASWRMAPWYSLAVAAVSLLFLVYGAAFNTGLTTLFQVSYLEVRPGYATTLGIVQASHSGALEALFGTGPNTFGEEWLLHKPADLNQSNFWNLDFSVGFSTVLTALATVGLVGAAFWLLPLILLLYALLLVFRPERSTHERILVSSLALGSVFLWTAAMLYAPSQNILLLAFALSGAALAGGCGGEERRPRARAVVLFLSLALLILSLGVGALSARRFVSEIFVNRGAAALAQRNVDGALADAARALAVEHHSDVDALLLAARMQQLQTLAADTKTPAETVQKEFSAVLTQTVPAGQNLILLHPRDYRAYLSIANLYEFLAGLKIQGAYENAQAAYKQAALYAPLDPEIPLALARLSAGQNDLALARQYVMQALTQKSNYTDAIIFIVQLDVAQKDVPGAIEAAKVAVQTAPGVASIWFQLGLLYYSENDTASAIAPLEHALSITPDYANAKYFLGLSYATQKRQQDAIKQFVDLQKSNPDNQEVALILKNLQEGKAPFAGAKPPTTTPPEQRPTAPLSQ